jgi:hypothetical protein
MILRTVDLAEALGDKVVEHSRMVPEFLKKLLPHRRRLGLVDMLRHHPDSLFAHLADAHASYNTRPGEVRSWLAVFRKE